STNLRDASELLERPRTEIERLDDLLRPLIPADRLIAIDFCRLIVHAPAFTDRSLRLFGAMKLSQYRALNQMICRLEAKLKKNALLTFRKEDFQAWRTEYQKQYLAVIRKQEKESKRAPRPYLDALDRKEEELFQLFWQERRLDQLAS